MEILWIALAAFAGSLLTFFSGFGLGTILLPVFLIFFPPGVAILLTAVVHLLNNLFKLVLIGRHAHWRVVLGFGLAALPAAWLGAILLRYLEKHDVAYTYTLGNFEGEVTWLKVIIAILMMGFALLELIPAEKQPRFAPGMLPVGGFLSGFFGGLSGHQGALRSAFLLRFGLSREAFIATGIWIACGIDFMRISVYINAQTLDLLQSESRIMIVAVLAALIGALLGKKLLPKVTMTWIQRIVAILIFILAILLATGVM
jgi:uncharacterized membrane protein YfcA